MNSGLRGRPDDVDEGRQNAAGPLFRRWYTALIGMHLHRIDVAENAITLD